MPVVLIGDSLAEEAAPYLAALLPDATLIAQYYGGTAPCDWSSHDLQIPQDSVVVISFIGNSTTQCMEDGAAGHLRGQALVDKYQEDIAKLIAAAQSANAEVLLIGQPARADSPAGNELDDGLNEMYVELATESSVRFVDAGATVEHSDGTFAGVLWCLPDEVQCGTYGNNVMRSNDGLHFCPQEPSLGACPVYSSGAFRFATAIADVIKPRG